MTKKKTNQKKSKKTKTKRSGQDCPDGVCPIKKPKAQIKSKAKKVNSKQKDIVSPPIAAPISIPVSSGNGILSKLKNIFSKFNFYDNNS
jgi:hypothetical protein